jgi:hypothetical protein
MTLAFETEHGSSATPDGMVWIPGRTFSMGSNDHYPEEAPAHPVTVEGFWIDETPVTNRKFMEFVKATNYVTFAEKTPDPKHYPGALPEMLKAGSLVFTQPKKVSGPDISQWWAFKFGANWRRPLGGLSDIRGKLDHPVVHVAYCDALAYADCSIFPPKRSGSLLRAAASTTRNTPGAANSCRAGLRWRIRGKAPSRRVRQSRQARNEHRPFARFRRTAMEPST